MPSIRGEVFFGFIDQSLISVMHFSIGLFFINFASKEEYGLYSIAFASILFIIGLGNAVITTQMTINSTDRSKGAVDVYCAEMLTAQTLMILPVILLILISIGILSSLRLIEISTALFIAIVGLACLGVLLHEFIRRLFFLRLKPHIVLFVDILRILLLAITTGLLLKSPLNIDFHSMMIAGYGLSALMSGYIGFKIATLPADIGIDSAKKSLSEAWFHGKWATLGVSVTWFQNQSYTYLLAALSGTSAIADANAARLFFAPIAMLTTSFVRIFMPRFSILRSEGNLKKIRDHSYRILRILTIIVIGYACIVFILKNTVLDVLYADKYQNITPLIVGWMFYFLFQGIRANASLILQVFKKFKYITLSSTVTSLVVVLVSVVLIHFYGVLGNIMGMIMGELILGLILWRVFAHLIKQ